MYTSTCTSLHLHSQVTNVALMSYLWIPYLSPYPFEWIWQSISVSVTSNAKSGTEWERERAGTKEISCWKLKEVWVWNHHYSCGDISWLALSHIWLLGQRCLCSNIEFNSLFYKWVTNRMHSVFPMQLTVWPCPKTWRTTSHTPYTGLFYVEEIMGQFLPNYV